ncbi:flagellar protein FlgN [Catenovulum sp. SM1970]|uniref:flagella synthesis protein FlgN n=1 Tax=Marinifaba aquimaris TaxID=2741323 RepID=UPI0015726D93|nr:flagellar protein FlgN [Marinifaba aquimaris]NTS75409.1 flagellar protein FlgN [Marinifaba aquimaris]
MPSAIELIEQQIDNLDQFNNLLIEELDAFKARQAEQILTLAEKKASLLDAIKNQDQAIASLPDLDSLKQDPEFKQAVEKCDEYLSALKQQTAINERVIQTSLNNVSQLKQSMLTIKSANSMTYTKSGKATASTLGKGIKA